MALPNLNILLSVFSNLMWNIKMNEESIKVKLIYKIPNINEKVAHILSPKIIWYESKLGKMPKTLAVLYKKK